MIQHSPLQHVSGAFFFSGFTVLGLQWVWMRMFSIGIGHELFSVLAVISAFFGGRARKPKRAAQSQDR